jgi:hypothetical protein
VDRKIILSEVEELINTLSVVETCEVETHIIVRNYVPNIINVYNILGSCDTAKLIEVSPLFNIQVMYKT